MNELERYIREQYGPDLQELEGVRQLAADALPTVVDSWSDKDKAWPYRFGAQPERYSFTTNSMILFMLSVVLEHTKTSSLLPSLPQNTGLVSMLFTRLELIFGKDYQQTANEHFYQGLASLFKNVKKEMSKKQRKGAKKNRAAKETSSDRLTDSPTYGSNDVLTLTWLTELLWVAQNLDLENQSAKALLTSDALHKPLGEAVERLRKATIEGFKDKSSARRRPQLRCLLYREQLEAAKPDRGGKRRQRATEAPRGSGAPVSTGSPHSIDRSASQAQAKSGGKERRTD
jgi:hypothetical protein